MTNYFSRSKEYPTSVTAHSVKDLPKGMWQYFKSLVHGRADYTSIRDRLIDQIAFDQAVFEKTGVGSIEYAFENDIVTESEFEETMTLEIPRRVDPDTIGEGTTIKDIPDGLWDPFLERMNRDPNYTRVGDRIIDHACLDVAINRKYNHNDGSLEYFVSNEIIAESDILDALEREAEDED